jgi:hypothetical protein
MVVNLLSEIQARPCNFRAVDAFRPWHCVQNGQTHVRPTKLGKHWWILLPCIAPNSGYKNKCCKSHFWITYFREDLNYLSATFFRFSRCAMLHSRLHRCLCWMECLGLFELVSLCKILLLVCLQWFSYFNQWKQVCSKSLGCKNRIQRHLINYPLAY